MDDNIRRKRLKMLVDKTKNDEGLSQARFAKKCGLDAAHLSQMLTGKRGIGLSVARRVEEAFLLEQGFLDRPISDDLNQEILTEAASLLNQMEDQEVAASLEFMKNLLKKQKLERKFLGDEE